MKSILIIGAGKFGSLIARRIAEFNCEVMVVDRNEENINSILPYVTNAIIGDCTNPEVIDSLGVNNYDVCFVSIGNDFQTSLEVTALLKDAGARKVVSRAASDIQMKFLLRNGADEVVFPEKQMATRIATKYASDSIIDFIQLADSDYSIYELKILSEWSGKSLKQLDIRNKLNVNIIAIRRDTEIFVPHGDTVLSENDIVFAIGEIKDLQALFKL